MPDNRAAPGRGEAHSAQLRNRRAGGRRAGLLHQERLSPVEAIFRDTKWARGAWERALRKIDGYFAPKNPIHFAAAKSKSRAIGLPIDLLPEIDLEELGRRLRV